MNFKKIKTQAKETIDGKLWDVWKPALIIGFISMIISVVATSIFGSESYLGQIVVSLFSLLLVPAEVGYISYMLKFVRKEDYSIDDLKQYYPQIGLLIVINILIYIFVLLGFICLIIPGIILSFAYTMVFYVFIDNPGLKAKDYLDMSKKLMDGYKFNYFCFCLSFIGWVLLCCLIIPIIWVVPYITTAQTLYYENLKELKNEEI